MLHQKSFSRFRIFILHLIVLEEIAEFMNDVQEILMRLMNGNGRFMI